MPLINTRIIALMAVIFVVFAIFYIQISQINSLKAENIQLIKDKQQYVDALDYQNHAIISNMQDQNKTKELPIIKDRIKTRYVYAQNEIIKWREGNATDCNSSMHFIDAFNF